MPLKYTFLSEHTNMKDTRLQICNSANRSISVLQYKAQGCLLYSHEKGIYSEDKKRQVKQIHEFLKIADSHGIDLVITPEASVPLDIVKKIIAGNEVRPERGKLWCLGVGGIAKGDYKLLIDDKSPIILNIQMNPKPFHEKIIGFRRTFFEDNDMRNAQMIAANWGRGTTICAEGTDNEDEGYSDSGSTIYFSLGNNHWQNSINSIFENRDFIINGIGEGQKSGLEYFLTR